VTGDDRCDPRLRIRERCRPSIEHPCRHWGRRPSHIKRC
jgi:hypothetical protein